MSGFDRDCGDADALFRAARGATEPSPSDQARIGRALAAKLGGSLVLASSAKAHASLQAGGRALGALKMTNLALLAKAGSIALVTVAGTWAVSREVTTSRPVRSHDVNVTAQVERRPDVESDRSAEVAAPSPPSTANSKLVSPAPDSQAAARASAPRSASFPPSIEGPRGAPSRTKNPPPSAIPIEASRLGKRLAAPDERTASVGVDTPSPGVAPNLADARSPGVAPNPAGAPKHSASLSEELALIARMHEASRAGDLATVDRLITEHEGRFPHGVLVEERDAMNVVQVCRRGEDARGREMAAEFSRQHPDSPHIERIAAACAHPRR